jgi:hypothetical protein
MSGSLWIGLFALIRMCLGSLNSCCGGIMWSVPALLAVGCVFLVMFEALLVYAGHTYANAMLPNFPLAFQFNVSFPLAIMVDFVQVVLLVCALVDGVAIFLKGLRTGWFRTCCTQSNRLSNPRSTSVTAAPSSPAALTLGLRVSTRQSPAGTPAIRI